MFFHEESQQQNEIGRKNLAAWVDVIKQNIYQKNPNFRHSLQFYLPQKFSQLDRELLSFADRVTRELEPLVAENNLPENLPKIYHYNSIAQKIEKIVHHPTYEAAGNIIYGSRLLERMSKPGGLLEALAFMYLSSHAGEAGHNCPIACSAGIIRVLQKIEDFPQKNLF